MEEMQSIQSEQQRILREMEIRLIQLSFNFCLHEMLHGSLGTVGVHRALGEGKKCRLMKNISKL